MASINPKKFAPVSPIKVFAGAKLNGKNPNNAPINAVINIIAIKGDAFNAKIINKDIQEINVIPDDSPSNPSVKFIAFVTATIHIIVNRLDIILLSIFNVSVINGTEICSILTPKLTTIIAASNCPASLVSGLIVFISSIIPVIAKQ